MEYGVVGITALIITLIICHSFIFTTKIKQLPRQTRAYRLFVISIIVFYIIDILWGIFEDLELMGLLYVDTVLFFISLGTTVFFWSRYLTIYIGGKGKTNAFMMALGIIILVYVVVMLIINIFNPVLFEFDDNNNYVAKVGRYSLFISQLVIFGISALGSVLEAFNKKKKNQKSRFLVISVFSIAMIVSIIFQIFYPLLPFYSIGCMVGICFVNTFVVESEREENRIRLEELLKRELESQKELTTTKELINRDSLTGALSKYAYVKEEEQIDKLINAKIVESFSVVVFDINGLKQINDTLGHQAGDKYIKDCYKLITDIYGNNKVYRFGGDEFVTILQDDDYDRREELLEKFNSIVDENLLENKPVVSTGMSDFDFDVDNTYRAVFVRADKKMYERKHSLKLKGSHIR